MPSNPVRALLLLLSLCLIAPAAHAAALHAGAFTTSITPDQPVALDGQMTTRIARTVESELQANALALESREGDAVIAQAIFVACDLVAIRQGVREGVQALLADRIPDFDNTRLILSATHTHTGPVTEEGKYAVDDPEVMTPTAYVAFLVERVADAAEAAWKARRPARAAWGQGHAVVGYNRRSYFADGHAQMYGDLSVDGFRGIEGPEDHAVEVLFFWDDNDALLATAVNVVCPAQEVESRSAVNADFWHPVREGLKEKHGQELVVLGWTGAAGDISPHIRYRQAAEDRMRKLRGLDRLDEIARRILIAWDEALAGAAGEKQADLALAHDVKTLELPERIVTADEVAEAKAEIEKWSQDPKFSRRVKWHEKVLERYARQQAGNIQPYITQVHTLRLGDVAIATNTFELFAQFGIQMKAKSPAMHTFLIQLCGPGTYVPTPQAAAGGGYSAVVQSNAVGPEGGQVLVDETVAALKALWPRE
ncbi:MAG: hypothetical protein KF886_00060 [Candidatus Hydrogenedentes bacterium]|nr:hypothetical protein [Candidatus Hydrogenedentota bacterium]